jgi:hypothetical protein
MTNNIVFNPFRYGSPVPPERFIGRENTLNVLFSRLHHGESAVVVGGPHMGKSSLLRYVACEEVNSAWLAHGTLHIIPVEQDCHGLPGDYQPVDFWRDVLAVVAEQPLERKVKTQLTRVRQSDYGSFTLERFFKLLGQSGRQVLLLIDEFEVLLNHPHLNTPEFFGALRALAIKTDGLALIAASRLPVAELNRRTQQTTGSPFFNFCIDVVLPPLSPADIGTLLDTALSQSDISFSDDDRHYIQRMSGRHPFLAQASAAALFEATRRETRGNERYTLASKLIQDWAGAHFDERWRYLDERVQQVLRTLAQAETRTSAGQIPADTGVTDFEQYSYDLRKLEKEHLIEPSPDAEGFLWRERRWHISAVSFAIWIAHNICELPEVRLEEADKVPDAEHGKVLPGHIIVYGDYIAGDKPTDFDQRWQDVDGTQNNAGRDIHNPGTSTSN